MKKYLFTMATLMVTAFAMTFVSCSKNDDNPPATGGQGGQGAGTVVASQLYGTWVCTYSLDYTEHDREENHMNGQTMTFKSDNTYTTSTGSQSWGSGTWTLNGNTLVAKRGTDDLVITVVLTLAGDELTMNGQLSYGGQFVYKFTRKK